MDGKYLTVETVIRDLLPEGSNGKKELGWDDCPAWAPDAFAVCATLARLSGCYAEPGIVMSRNAPERKAKQRRAKREAKEGKASMCLWARCLVECSVANRTM